VLFTSRALFAPLIALLAGTCVAGSGSVAPEASLRLGHLHEDGAIAFAPKQNVLASGDNGRAVLLWDLKTGRQLRTLLGHSGSITALSFGIEGSLLASSDFQGTVMVWNTSTGMREHSIQACSGEANAVAFQPTQTHIVIACSRFELGTLTTQTDIAIWDFESNSLRRVAIGRKSTPVIAFARDGYLLAVGSDTGTVQIWKTDPREKASEVPGNGDEVRRIAISEDGSRLLLSTSKLLREWDLARQRASKYPPAEPGALVCEPLKAAMWGR
jgi:WD40 repeat protein